MSALGGVCYRGSSRWLGCLLPGGCLLWGCLLQGVSAPRGWAVSAPGDVCSPGGCLLLGVGVSALGVSALGVSALGGVCSGGGSAPGGSAPGGVCSQRGVCSGGVAAPRGVSAPGGVSQHALRQTPPLLTASQTPVKTLSWPNFVVAGNNLNNLSIFFTWNLVFRDFAWAILFMGSFFGGWWVVRRVTFVIGFGFFILGGGGNLRKICC